MKKKLVVGNWKMHLNASEASTLVHRLDERIKAHRSVEVILAPTMLTLQPMSVQIDRRKFKLAAQNAYHKDEGAFTGEVSFTMLQDLVHYCLVGHSERRMYFGETLDSVRDKVSAAVRNDIVPIICIGETRQERRAGETRQVLHDQLVTALADLTDQDVANVVIAYEPVWAIGAGDPAKPAQILEATKFIRKQIHDLYGADAAEAIRILYGASVEPEFVGGILGLGGIDGLLVGGASLNYHKFSAIVDATYKANVLEHEHGTAE